MKPSYFSTAILALVAQAAAVQQHISRIVGGTPATSALYNFAASITSVDPNYMGKKCSGILIGNNTVLTTANCLTTSGQTFFNASLITVSFRGKGGEATTLKAQKTLVAGKFTPYTYSHNIGIIVLASAVPATTATPVKIYTGAIGQGLPLYAVGYGASSPSKSSIDQAPRFALLKVLDSARCSAYERYDNATQLCVDGRQGRDVCSGDEGAALVMAVDSGEYAVVGMASYSTAASGGGGAMEVELPACGDSTSVSYFEMAGVWAQWIAQAASLSYTDITINTKAPATTGGDEQQQQQQQLSTATDGVATAGALSSQATSAPPTHSTPSHSSANKADGGILQQWVISFALVVNALILY